MADRRKFWCWVILTAIAPIFVGCGNVGAPLPPSLHLPEPVQDLRAVRQGTVVRLTWTVPAETTDNTKLTRLGITRVCRSGQPQPTCQEIATIPAAPTAPGTAALYTQNIQPEPGGQDFYAVEVLNDRGRSAGLSNVVAVSLAPTLPPPAELRAQVQPNGVLLQWQAEPPPGAAGLSFNYRISRRAEGAETPISLREVDVSTREVLDSGVEWEKRYTYFITPLTIVPPANGAEPTVIEGDASRPIEVLVHDTFAPAAPAEVQAVFAPANPGFIDLTWSPNNEEDLAGYFVFRQEGSAPPARLNPTPVAAPTFRDQSVVAGGQYAYTVVAVDLRGNQSPPSPPARETVPQR